MEKITIKDLVRIAGKAYVPNEHDGYAVYDKETDRIIPTWEKPEQDDKRYILIYTIPKDVDKKVYIEFIDEKKERDEFISYLNSGMPDQVTYMVLKKGLEATRNQVVEAVAQQEWDDIYYTEEEKLPENLKDYVLPVGEEKAVLSER